MSHRNTCRGHLQAGKSSGRWQKGPLNVQNKRAPVCAGQQTAKARVAWRSPFAAFFLNLLSHNLFLHNCCVSFYNPACGRQHYGNRIFHPKYFLSTQFWWYTTLVLLFKKDLSRVVILGTSHRHFRCCFPGSALVDCEGTFNVEKLQAFYFHFFDRNSFPRIKGWYLQVRFCVDIIS